MGIQDLMSGSKMTGLRQVLCVMTLLGYHLIVCYVLSHQEGDLNFCDEVLNRQLTVSSIDFKDFTEISSSSTNSSSTRTEYGFFSSKVDSSS